MLLGFFFAVGLHFGRFEGANSTLKIGDRRIRDSRLN